MSSVLAISKSTWCPFPWQWGYCQDIALLLHHLCCLKWVKGFYDMILLMFNILQFSCINQICWLSWTSAVGRILDLFEALKSCFNSKTRPKIFLLTFKIISHWVRPTPFLFRVLSLAIGFRKLKEEQIVILECSPV